MLLLYQWTRLACQVRTVVCRVRCWVRSWILFSPRACIALSNTRKANPHEWHFLHTFYFLFLTIYFVFNCVYCGGGACTHMNAGAQGSEESNKFPGCGVKGSISHPVWVLGTRFQSSARTVHTLNHWAISPNFSFLMSWLLYRVYNSSKFTTFCA